MIQIGEKLKTLRSEKHLTQKDLAEKLNVSAQAVSRWENDEVEPSLETLGQLATIFSVSIDELFGKEPAPKQEPTPAPAPAVRYVETAAKPVLAVCETCNKPLYRSEEIRRKTETFPRSRSVSRGVSTEKRVLCVACDEKEKLNKLRIEQDELNTRWKRAWIWSPIASIALLALFIVLACLNKDIFVGLFIGGIALSVLLLTFLVCVFLDNTFIGEMWEDVSSWGFSTMPGIIFSLDFDGIVFLIAVKVLFAILSFVVAVCATVLATVLGLILGVFAFPFALSFHRRDLDANLASIERAKETLAQYEK